MKNPYTNAEHAAWLLSQMSEEGRTRALAFLENMQRQQEPNCACPNGHAYRYDGNSDDSGCPICGKDFSFA